MKTIFSSICLLVSIITSAQDSSKVNRPLFLYALAAYDIPKTYGFTIGTSVPLHHMDHERKKFEKDDVVSGEIGFYRRPFVYTTITAQASIGIRYIRSEKYFTELSFNQGVMRTIYDGKVYEVDANGNIKELTLYGRNYLISGISWSLNWKLNNRKSSLWFIYFKPSCWAQYPYNSFLRFHFSTQTGVSYSLKNIEVRSHTKYRS